VPDNTVLVVEEDPFLRLVGVLLDPATPAERLAAFADFFAHDEPDFAGYCGRVRAQVGALYPAQVRIVDTQEELRAALPGARAVVVESLKVGPEEVAIGRDLKLVQKFGMLTRNIDAAVCAARGIEVRTIRRRSNVACAEMAFALMLTMAKKLNRMLGRTTADELAAMGFPYKPYDRRHTPNSNWGRIPGVRMLDGSTLGIVGLGEIGREIAIRGAAFGMRILYSQRTQLPETLEREIHARYVPLATLMAESDFITPALPISPSVKGLIGREQLAVLKPGAIIANVSWAPAIDRDALIEALPSGRLGGFALDPLYDAPGRPDDELRTFPNVALSPHLAAQPRSNSLGDLAEICEGMARALAE
jgi:phosphoglycerate dehydrogenase-like enzyme